MRSSDNEYNLSLMASFIAHWGKPKALAWAKGVVANFARPPQAGDIDEIRAVGAGACKATLTNTYYYLRIAASKAPEDKRTAAAVALAFPEQATTGTHVNISGGGVAAHAPHKANAIAFLDFLASDEAQNIFAEDNHEFPAVPSVKPRRRTWQRSPTSRPTPCRCRPRRTPGRGPGRSTTRRAGAKAMTAAAHDLAPARRTRRAWPRPSPLKIARLCRRRPGDPSHRLDPVAGCHRPGRDDHPAPALIARYALDLAILAVLVAVGTVRWAPRPPGWW